MKHERFGAALRAFVDQVNLKDRNRWFRESVGREDRYLRRWCQGVNLPSADNWKLFIAALRKDRGHLPDFEEHCTLLEALLSQERHVIVGTRAGSNKHEATPLSSKTGSPSAHFDSAEENLGKEESTGLPILAIATEWFSRHGGVSTLNRLLCKALADLGNQVVCVAESPTHEEIESAQKDGVTLLGPRVWPGIAAREALGQPFGLPFGFHPAVIIGHGSHTGPAAKVQKENWYRTSLRVHFIHVDSGVIEHHKQNPDHGYRADDKVLTELPLAGTADIVVGVGPRLFKAARDLVISASPTPLVIRLDPGFEAGVVRERIPDRQILLITGRMEDAHLKGLDIAAEALGTVRRSGRIKDAITLRVRGAPLSDQEALRKSLQDTSGLADIIFDPRPFSTNPTLRQQDFLEASLALMPSREDGFGLAALEALEQGTPVLVSDKTGIADLLKERFSDCVVSMVVDTPDDRGTAAKHWAARIADVLSNRHSSFTLAKALQARFALTFPWKKSAKQLLGAVESVAIVSSDAISASLPSSRSDKAVQISTKRLTACAWSPDGKLLYAGGFEGVLYCCDLDLRERRKLRVSPSIIRVVKCLANIPLPLVGDDRGRLLLADVANSATLELASSDSSIFAVESTGDNKIVICDRNGAVTEWQIQGSSSGLARPTAVLLRSVHEHSGPAFAVQWDKWHRCILSVGADGYQRSLDVRTGARSAVKCSDHALFSMIVSDSYDFVAVGTQDGLINIFKGNKQQTFAGHSDAVRSVSISPKARWLASGSKDASVRLWDVSTGRAWLLVQTQDYVYEVAFSPTGNHILAVDGAGVMRVISFPRLIDELSPNDVDKMCANV